MSLLATVRNALQSTLQAVPDVGVVHAYERYTREETKFRELYTVKPSGQTDAVRQLKGWWLRRTGTAERTLGVGRTEVVHTWRVRGFMALNDEQASELAFDELVEALRDAVRADPTLGGVCAQSPLADGGSSEDGLQLLEAGPVMFCGVLCHSAVLEMKTWSYL